MSEQVTLGSLLCVLVVMHSCLPLNSTFQEFFKQTRAHIAATSGNPPLFPYPVLQVKRKKSSLTKDTNVKFLIITTICC